MTDHKGYKEALRQQERAWKALEAVQAQVQEFQQQVQEADAAGASFQDLQAAQDKVEEGGRAAELADRELDQAAAQVQDQLLEAEAHIKEAAKEAGKKIVIKIYKALAQVERGQEEYRTLLAELQAKVDFPRPLSGENAGRYAGPDPAPVFSAYAWPVKSYRESTARYLKDWPEPEKLKSRKYEPAGQIMLG